jgi:ABC-type phosphate/phosphonate transport system permease subunit
MVTSAGFSTYQQSWNEKKISKCLFSTAYAANYLLRSYRPYWYNWIKVFKLLLVRNHSLINFDEAKSEDVFIFLEIFQNIFFKEFPRDRVRSAHFWYLKKWYLKIYIK